MCKALKQEARVTPRVTWYGPGTLEKSMAKTPVFEKITSNHKSFMYIKGVA